MATFGSVLYFLSLYFQDVRGYDALQTGVGFLLPTAVVVAGSASAGRLVTRFGLRRHTRRGARRRRARRRRARLAMTPDGSYAALIPGWSRSASATASSSPRCSSPRRRASPTGEQGVAAGIASTGARVGAAVGLAVLVLVANAGTDGLAGEALRTATADGIRTAVLVVAAGIAVTALLAASLRPRSALRVARTPCPRRARRAARRGALIRREG